LFFQIVNAAKLKYNIGKFVRDFSGVMCQGFAGLDFYFDSFPDFNFAVRIRAGKGPILFRKRF